MKMGLLQVIKEYWALQKFKKSPLGEALRQHTQEFFYGDTVLVHFSDANKQKLIGDFTQKLAEIYDSPNWQATMRRSLTEFVLAYASLEVLCLKESERSHIHYGKNPYISGTLYHRISDAVAHTDELGRFVFETGGEQVPGDLISFCNTRCALYLYYMNGINLVRISNGDEVDWYKPFVEAMMVWAEGNIRHKLDMPQLIEGYSGLGHLCYFSFMNFVLDGSSNPFFEWSKSNSDLPLYGRGGD